MFIYLHDLSQVSLLLRDTLNQKKKNLNTFGWGEAQNNSSWYRGRLVFKHGINKKDNFIRTHLIDYVVFYKKMGNMILVAVMRLAHKSLETVNFYKYFFKKDKYTNVLDYIYIYI